MHWIYLLVAGCMEVFGVISLRYTDGFTKIKPSILLVLFMSISFYCLSLSLKVIPISIAYGVWTGVGAAGSVLTGMLIFNENKSPLKLLLVFGIIFSIIGLKVVS
jgi:quaternary ammonium compound-resistance protein SugE